MSNYEILLEMPTTVLRQLVATSIIRPTVEREMQIFEHYNRLCAKLPRMQARLETAEKFCTSEETIKRTIKRLR